LLAHPAQGRPRTKTRFTRQCLAREGAQHRELFSLMAAARAQRGQVFSPRCQAPQPRLHAKRRQHGGLHVEVHGRIMPKSRPVDVSGGCNRSARGSSDGKKAPVGAFGQRTGRRPEHTITRACGTRACGCRFRSCRRLPQTVAPRSRSPCPRGGRASSPCRRCRP